MSVHTSESLGAGAHARRVGTRLVRGVDRLSTVCGEIAKYLVIAVFAVGIVNVALRYAGRWTGSSLSSNRWIETQWYLFGAIFLLGFPYVLRHQLNPRVDFWYTNFSARRKALIDGVGHLVFLLPFTWLALRVLWTPTLTSFGRSPDGSWRTWRVWEIWEQSPDPDGLPRAPIRGLIVVGFVLLGVQTIAEIVRAALVVSGRTELAVDRDEPLRVE